jgi:hypothetical protein
MKTAMCLAFLFCLSSPSAFAGTWSGFLVDSGCFEMRENDVNPTDADTYVDRDRDLEVRLCYPSGKTKGFVVVQQNGLSFNLDSAGNAKAAELFQKTVRKEKSYFPVVVKGDMSKNTVKVASISVAK